MEKVCSHLMMHVFTCIENSINLFVKYNEHCRFYWLNYIHDFIIKKKQYVNCVFLLVFTCKQPGACYAHRVMNYKFIAKWVQQLRDFIEDVWSFFIGSLLIVSD